jgi:hypothetical protein
MLNAKCNTQNAECRTGAAILTDPRLGVKPAGWQLVAGGR